MDSVFAGDPASGAMVVGRLHGEVLDGPDLRRPDPHGTWAPLPGGWIREGGLKLYRNDPSHAGRSIAALKLFLTLTVLAGGPTAQAATQAASSANSVLISYEEIAGIAGLSRPLIASARKILCNRGLLHVTYEGQGERVRYHLVGEASALGRVHHARTRGYADLPTIACLRRLSSRDVRNLHALKLYLLMSGLRAEGQREVALSRTEIEGYTSLRESQAFTAFSILRRHGLVTADARMLRRQGPAERFAATVHPLS